METTEQQSIQDTEKVSKGILFCRKRMASKREMQEEAQKDWYVPKFQAALQEL